MHVDSVHTALLQKLPSFPESVMTRVRMEEGLKWNQAVQRREEAPGRPSMGPGITSEKSPSRWLGRDGRPHPIFQSAIRVQRYKLGH